MAACEGPTGPHLSGAAHLLADSNGDATTRVHGRACRGSYRHWRLGYLPPILRQPCVADMTGRSAARGGKMGSAASPSRYSGRPEAGHDSKDARPPLPPLCETSLICGMRLFAARLQSTPESSRTLLILPPPGAARLFSCPLAVLALSDRLDANFSRRRELRLE